MTAARGIQLRHALASRLRAAALLLAMTPAVAGAACPDAATAPRGFRLSHPSGRFIEVKRIEADVVHYHEQIGPNPSSGRDVASYRGVMGLSSEGAGERFDIAWASPPESVFPIKAGAVHELDFIVRSSKGTARKAHFRLEVASAPVGLAVGRCGYEVWALKREVVFADNGLRIVGTDYWSPALSMYLRRDSEALWPGKAPSSFSLTYDTIEARP